MIKINDTKVGTTFTTTCTKSKHKEPDENGVYTYDCFGISPKHAGIWGRSAEDCINVKCTIIEEDVLVDKLMRKNSSYDTNSVDYFGWISFEDDDSYHISMIFKNIKLYFVCFPYGVDCERFYDKDITLFDVHHKAGDRRGMTVRLKIEEI